MRWRQNALMTAAVLIGLPLLVLVVSTPLDQQAQLVFGAGLLAAALLLDRLQSKLVTVILATMSVLVSTRYMVWRLSRTISPEWSLDFTLAAILLAAEIYAFAILLLGYLQTIYPLKRRPVPLPAEPNTWPTVDIFIPTYNEPLDVVRATVLAAKTVDWPAAKRNVFILDDGRREAFRAFAARVGVGYLTRDNNTHAKAGNLNAALERTSGEYVVIFDCDHVPTRSFLQMTMGWFLKDEKLALIQTPHHFHSPDPFERNLGIFRRRPNEGELFYGLVQPGNDLWNAVLFCGSCAVMRRTALASVGGIACESVTEDAHTSLRLHRKGWRSAYLHVPQASGLATETVSAHVGQRIRWARGMTQIFRLDNPLLGRGLKPAQRLCFLNAMLHFLYGIPRLIFILAPSAYLLLGARIFNATPLLVLAYALPHMAHALLTNSRMQGPHRCSFWNEVYEAVLAVYIAIPTTVALLAPTKGRFNVTAKGGLSERDYFDGRIAFPWIALLALNTSALIAGGLQLYNHTPYPDVTIMNLFWASWNQLILATAIAVAVERRQLRASPRIAHETTVVAKLPSGHTVSGKTQDLSLGGAKLRLPESPQLEAGTQIVLTLAAAGVDYALSARVMAASQGTLRVRFAPLGVEEEAWLVRTLYGRADAWLNWNQGPQRDNPVREAFAIMGHGLAGLLRVIRVATMSRKAARA